MLAMWLGEESVDGEGVSSGGRSSVRVDVSCLK